MGPARPRCPSWPRGRKNRPGCGSASAVLIMIMIIIIIIIVIIIITIIRVTNFMVIIGMIRTVFTTSY